MLWRGGALCRRSEKLLLPLLYLRGGSQRASRCARLGLRWCWLVVAVGQWTTRCAACLGSPLARRFCLTCGFIWLLLLFWVLCYDLVAVDIGGC